MSRASMVCLVLLLPLLAGCPVFQSQDTPVEQFRQREPATGKDYWLYIPSSYTPARKWPLVITLHGTHGFDSASAQIREWKALAEEKGFIVAAPSLESPQGILPVLRASRASDLQSDEQVILACLSDVQKRYQIDSRAVMLTGFSAGGYSLYYVGLRNPGSFSVLAARACNSDMDIFENIEPTDEARKLTIIVMHGKDDLGPIGEQSWAAFRWLREHGFRKAEHYKLKGGHIRQPQAVWDHWRPLLPPELAKATK